MTIDDDVPSNESLLHEEDGQVDVTFGEMKAVVDSLTSVDAVVEAVVEAVGAVEVEEISPCPVVVFVVVVTLAVANVFPSVVVAVVVQVLEDEEEDEEEEEDELRVSVFA